MAFGCVAASALVSGCSSERPRSAPVPSVRVEPARAATEREVSRTRRTVARDTAASSVAGTGDDTLESSIAPPPERARPTPQPAAVDPIATPRAELEPGVNEEFDEDVLLDIGDALSAIDENAFATLFKKVQVVVDGELVKKERFAHPDNCRRWRYYRNQGYAAKSSVAKQIDAGALVRCGSLEFLARARPSRRTHVRNLLVGSGPSTLPAILASATSPLARESRDRAVAKGATLSDFLPSARVIPSEVPGRLSISEPPSSSSIILNAEVWGDVNSDGIEDLVLSVLNSDNDGSAFDIRLLQVTRASPSSPL
ncbi:MAG TPA: hypothetical protein VMG12_10735, partial [Polyangiaceae bacterium]|nr:hypothetical protein [Polyangiaceae bacterium]